MANQTPKNTSTYIDTCIRDLKDPRRVTKGNFIYPLNEIFFLVISAVISGTEDWKGIELFGKSKIDWLKRFLPYENGTPSHDVLGKLFARIDVGNFQAVFIKWINSISKVTCGEIIPIDGKTIKGSGDSGKPNSAIHVVSAYAAKQNLCLGQTVVDKKHNEIVAIPEILELIAVKGCIVTIDAMGCQKKIAKKIIEKEADYVLMVKDNQQELKEQVEKLFELQTDKEPDETIDSGHGRIETRKCEMIDDLKFLDGKEQWHGLNSVVKITSTRFEKKSKNETKEIRYYISSLDKDSERLNSIIRSHWSIENNLHWRLDFTFKEDKQSKKKDNSASNFNIISKIAMTLIDKEKTKNQSLGKKRLLAAWNDEYREKILKC
jgi:predicted transposase YbfD/YdcC